MEQVSFLSKINPKHGFLIISFLSFSAVIAALVSQHIFNMQPCAWCVLQRLIFILIGFVSLICYFIKEFKFISYGAISGLATLGMFVAIYQYLVASKSFDCNISLAEKIITTLNLNSILPDIFGIYAMCADANPEILGLKYVVWSFLLFAIITDIAGGFLIVSIKQKVKVIE